MRGKGHPLEESCGATFDLAVQDLGRETGAVGVGLQDRQQHHYYIGSTSSAVDRSLPQGLNGGFSLRPDTLSRGLPRVNHPTTSLPSKGVVRGDEQGAGPDQGDEVDGGSRFARAIDSAAEIPQQAAG